MNIEHRIIEKLRHIEDEMRAKSLWVEVPPSADAFLSTEPFCLDTMEAIEWLQWVLIPRLYALIEQKNVLPGAFAITPYFEEVYKNDEEGQYHRLLAHLRELDYFFSTDSHR